MGRGRFRNWWPLVVVTSGAVVVAWLLYLGWKSPLRNDLATYGAFALPVAAVIVGWLTWAWRKGEVGQPVGADSDALDHAADRLSAAVQAQWKKAAEERGLTGADPIRVTWGRPSQAMAGPATAAAGSRRCDPLPGLGETRQAQLASGHAADLHALYGGLRSGRLVIAGPPGSGKTGAAVLLVLDALRHRGDVSAEQRPRVPVPVLFTAQDWDPAGEPAAHWLIRKLQGTYPLLVGAAGAATAAALLDSGRITVILDGLDEIGPGLQPLALQALSLQATFRLVLLSRTSEMADAARQGILQGAAAIELNPVSPAEAASYLERVQLDPAPAGWRELTRRIRACPGSPLSTALDNPLALTLIRDSYQAGDSVSELLRFCDTLDGLPASQAAEAVTGHLLDRVLPAAYTPSPGQPPPPYDLATAQRTLSAIAARMNQDGTRDLNWWQIPAWTPRAPRIAASAIANGLAYGVMVGLVAGFLGGPVAGLVAGLAAVPVCGLVAGLATGTAQVGGGRPHVIGRFQLAKALSWKNLKAGIVSGLVCGSLAAIAFGIAAGIKPGAEGVPGTAFVGAGGAVGLVASLVAIVVFGLQDALTDDRDSRSTLNPASSWKESQKYRRAIARTVFFAAWLTVGLPIGLESGSWIGLEGGFVIGYPFAIAAQIAVATRTESVLVSYSARWLARKWRTPKRLMRFLKDAHDRNVLRAVGPSYQFRHARLQDRLAAAASSPDGSAPAGTAAVRPADLPL